MLGSVQEILTTIIFGTILFLAMATVIVISIIHYQNRQLKNKVEKQLLHEEYQQQILQAQLETQEETFNEISKELHDNIGQLLNTSKLLLGIVQRNPNDGEDTLRIAEETLGKAIQEIRSLSKSMSKDWLLQFDLIENLEGEIGRINQSGAFQMTFSHQIDFSLDKDRQVVLFRIIQEAIQNMVKHASATQGNIVFAHEKAHIKISISDNGRGFDTDRVPNTGLGIRNMEHRMALLGGQIHWDSSNQGTTVTITLPQLNKL